VGDSARLGDDRLRRIFDGLEDEARERLAKWFDGPIRGARSAEMRYGEQIFEIDVPLDDVDWSGATPLDQVVARFHARHETLYTYAMPGQEVVLVNARVAAVGELPDLAEQRLPPAPSAPDPVGARRIHLGEWRRAPLYELDALGPGQSFAGPAVVEAETTTVLLGQGDVAKVTEHGWLDIALR